MLSDMMQELATERRASLIDGLVQQGAKVEELAFLFDMSVTEMVLLLELECIDIVHRISPLTDAEKQGLLETRSEFIQHLRMETWDDEALSFMFNVYDIQSMEFMSDEEGMEAIADFQRYMQEQG